MNSVSAIRPVTVSCLRTAPVLMPSACVLRQVPLSADFFTHLDTISKLAEIAPTLTTSNKAFFQATASAIIVTIGDMLEPLGVDVEPNKSLPLMRVTARPGANQLIPLLSQAPSPADHPIFYLSCDLGEIIQNAQKIEKAMERVSERLATKEEQRDEQEATNANAIEEARRYFKRIKDLAEALKTLFNPSEDLWIQIEITRTSKP